MSWPLRVSDDVAHFFAALAQSPDPVFVTNRNNRLVFWNQSAEKLLGYTSEEMVGSSCAGELAGADIHGNRYCCETCPVTQMALRGETVRNFALHFRGKNGETVTADVSILSLPAKTPDAPLLAHILKPAPLRGRSPAEPATEREVPRSPLQDARESPDARARKLTAREVEVLGMLAAGWATPELAGRLGISVLTARNHVQNILDKLEVHSKAEAVAFAFQKRLLS